MNFYLSLPILYLKFWFYEAPLAVMRFFASLNSAFLQLFSLPLFVKTFFKPLKNEYRQGLVGFSIGMGIVFKTILILVDLLLFSVLLAVEFICIAFFFAWPFLLVYSLNQL